MRIRGNIFLRWLDRYVGPPLLAAASAARRRRPVPSGWTRIALLKTSAIGDTVLLSAIAGDIRREHPQARITLVCGQDNRAIADLVDSVDDVLPVSLARLDRAVPRMRAAGFDVLLDFAPWPRIDAILAAASGARFSAGFRTANQRRHWCYDTTVEHRADRHELENYRALLGVLGVRGERLPRLVARGLVRRADLPRDRFLIFHLFPGGFRSHLREWPDANWRELARRMRDRGWRILLSGAGDDRPRAEAFAAYCAAAGTIVESVAGRWSLAEMLDVIAASDAVVSVNTGMVHIAAAVGATTIALNGPTNTMRWGPIGPNAHSIDSRLPGCGYLNLGFEYRGQREDCMAGIPVDDVEAALLARLEDAEGRRSSLAR